MKKREPDFENILRIMRRERPLRPTLYELFLNMPLYERAVGRPMRQTGDAALDHIRFIVEAFTRLGYDYATHHGSALCFETGHHERRQTISLNEGALIRDRASFERYKWPDPDACDYSVLGRVAPYLPDGMKLKVMGPGGVLENVISLVGYDDLCFMLHDDPELARMIFDGVGSRLVRHYELALQYDTVGLICSNDDWGFNTQTFLSPAMMREYVFPWHRRIVQSAHAAGRPVMLHSCGNLRDVMGDIIDMGYDAKHSFEDGIQPVEQAYEQYHDRIALLGGLDVDFVCTRSQEQIAERARAMLQRVEQRGGYALGTGNSVPEYVPDDKYFAMTSAALGYHPLQV